MLTTVWIPQRCSRSYIEKRRGRKKTKVARRIKGGIKNRETNQAHNQFPKCSQQTGNPHRYSLSWVEKKRGRGEIEAAWWRKRRGKRGSDLTPKYLKGTELIANTKKQRLKILSRG